MHFNNCVCSHFTPQISNCTGLVCLVLTSFPENTDLNQTKSRIEQEYSFINNVNVTNNHEIQCYFESMTDLIELYQSKKYEAAQAFIRNFEINSTKLNEEKKIQKHTKIFINSGQTFDSDSSNNLQSYKCIPSREDFQNNQKRILHNLHYYRRERLTSLQDQIEELENIRNNLTFFKQESNYCLTDDPLGNQSEEHSKTLNEKQLIERNINNENTEKNILNAQNSNFSPLKNIKGNQTLILLLEGIVLTGFIYGGFKLLKKMVE